MGSGKLKLLLNSGPQSKRNMGVNHDKIRSLGNTLWHFIICIKDLNAGYFYGWCCALVLTFKARETHRGGATWITQALGPTRSSSGST